MSLRPEGLCAICRGIRPVNVDGTVRKHQRIWFDRYAQASPPPRNPDGRVIREPCPGSGLPPAGPWPRPSRGVDGGTDRVI